MCGELEAAGLLDRADRAVLTVYVYAWSTHKQAAEEVAQSGATMVYPNGQSGATPSYKVMKAEGERLEKLLGVMGLTPAARRRMKAEEKEPEPDLEF